MKNFAMVLAVLAASILPSPAVGAPVAAVDVASMARQADLIVAGWPAEQIQAGHVVVAVDRVLKGDAAGSTTLRIELAEGHPGSALRKEYGLFFLRSVGIQSYVPADAFHPALVAVPAGPAARIGAAGTVSRVAAELAAVIGAEDSVLTVAAPDQSLTNLVALAHDARRRAVDALVTLPRETTLPLLTTAASVGNVTSRLWASAGLLRLGQTAALKSVVAELLAPAPGRVAAVHAIAGAMSRTN